jgi:cytochrome oxidase Cu insertion factor (SCO1/SenC/PrrC family)
MSKADKQPNRSRLPVILLAAIFVLPVVLAVLVFNIEDFRPRGMTNHGELVIPARPLHVVGFKRPDGSDFNIEDLKKYWTLVYIGDSKCDEACQEKIYIMRQVRWSQGDEMNRVNRLFIVVDEGGLPNLKALIDKYPGMSVATGNQKHMQAFVDQFELKGKPAAVGAGRLYIVDPLGNLMMSYPADAEPKGILKDLKKLLKVSQIG